MSQGKFSEKPYTKAKIFCENDNLHFRSDNEILDLASAIFLVRAGIKESKEGSIPDDAVRLERKASRLFHSGIRRSLTTQIGKTFGKHRLNQIEKEIVLLLTLQALGFEDYSAYGEIRIRELEEYRISQMQKHLVAGNTGVLQLAKVLSPNGRLALSGLVHVEHDPIPARISAEVSTDFLEPMLHQAGNRTDMWNAKSYTDFLDKCFPLVKALIAKSDELDNVAKWRRDEVKDLKKFQRQISHLMEGFRNTIKAHPSWPLKPFQDLLSEQSKIVLLLLGKELGYADPSDSVFRGEGLAMAVATDVPEIRHKMNLLRSGGFLRRQKIIRVCGGIGDSPIADDDAILRTCEFELTDEFLEKIKVKRKKQSKQNARKPLVRMDQLVLSSEVKAGIEMAMTQARNGDVMLNDWGLGKMIPYPLRSLFRCQTANARSLAPLMRLTNSRELTTSSPRR